MKNKKKIINIVSASLLGTIGIGLVVGFSVDWNFPNWIYVSGSSTTQPLINEISKIYSDAEIISEAGGSSTGITNVVQKTKDVGATSREPKISEAGLPAINNGDQAQIGTYSTEWNALRMKTITIGYDGIGIIYKCNNMDQSKDLVIGNDNIINLYSAFSGENKTLKDLDDNLPNIPIKPYARTGGANTSGTAEAFLKDSGFDLSNVNDPNWKKVEKKLESGEYGPNVQQTAESNLITWSSIKVNSNNNNYAYMTYLSVGFIKNNYYDIINSGFKIALYKQKGTNNIVKPIIKDNETGKLEINDREYKWFRPLDLIVRLNDDSKNFVAIQSFIEWLRLESLNENSKLVSIYNSLGYIPTKNDQWNSMCQNYTFDKTNFWVSDYELYEKQYDKRKQTHKYYGAI